MSKNIFFEWICIHCDSKNVTKSILFSSSVKCSECKIDRRIPKVISVKKKNLNNIKNENNKYLGYQDFEDWKSSWKKYECLCERYRKIKMV